MTARKGHQLIYIFIIIPPWGDVNSFLLCGKKFSEVSVSTKNNWTILPSAKTPKHGSGRHRFRIKQKTGTTNCCLSGCLQVPKECHCETSALKWRGNPPAFQDGTLERSPVSHTFSEDQRRIRKIRGIATSLRSSQ